jgi:MFS family permease
MRSSNRKNLKVLSFSLIVVMLGFGMVVPILQFYIERMGAGGGAFGLLVAMAALTELIFGPLWGSLSDRTHPAGWHARLWPGHAALSTVNPALAPVRLTRAVGRAFSRHTVYRHSPNWEQHER